ncbi:tRNA (guanine-N(7)-)-methyltransferase [Mycoplasmopsis maculosa]|uniref:tRNA (guanine-N(7)-)-methyltransferase n=1 Tax=Mycoplasmopsis maculosa TaxID=114885 RepID=A0A449B4H0_9BACT|nr:tRNA (guanosine(46)-N7)-methyltransferase TrmB [Mycoplasmopsis maculosa]VEU75504.1 tRNA (guanine-N(7)-)-methyltransferase [Mycoplasmopsis maculosa]
MRLRNDNKAEQKLLDSGFLYEFKNKKIQLKNDDVLEIGMGKGEMIVELAYLNPNINFYGLEKYATVAAKCIKKAKEYDLKNFKIILEDASKIEEIFEGECNTIWLTFSDPWPKARHEKRRLTYKSFLKKYSLILSKNGLLKFKSDNDKLYEFSLESLLENNWIIIDNGTDLHNSFHNSSNIKTGYETKWSSLGKNINYIFAKKPIL